jgi:hypothetical protein
MIYLRKLHWDNYRVSVVGETEITKQAPTRLNRKDKADLVKEGVFINFRPGNKITTTFEIVIDGDKLEQASKYRLNSDMDGYIETFINDVKVHIRHLKLKELLE